MEAGLKRFWFEFDVPPLEPYKGPGVSLDGPDAWSGRGRLRRGVGVTGTDAVDCLEIIQSKMFNDSALPPVRRMIENVDVSSLGEDVLVNMEVPIWRGIWFPRGYADPPTS